MCGLEGLRLSKILLLGVVWVASLAIHYPKEYPALTGKPV